jgi:hypothetical protein
MSSSNRRRSWITGVVAVGALLAAVAPTTQAQAEGQNKSQPAAPAQHARPSEVAPSGPIKSLLGQSLTTKAKSRATSKAKAAAPTQVDSVCKVTGYSPTSVVIGGSVAKRDFVPTVEGCTLKYYQVWVLPFVTDDEDNYDGISWQDSPTAILDPHYLLNEWVGKQKGAVAVYAWGEEDPVDDPDYDVQPATADLDFQILRRSSFGDSFNASPEPVKKGKDIKIKGTLTRINLTQAASLKYKGFANAPVQVQFKEAGTSEYKTVKTVQTTDGGAVSTTVKASKTGAWRIYFAGYSTTSEATSGGDNVEVN